MVTSNLVAHGERKIYLKQSGCQDQNKQRLIDDGEEENVSEKSVSDLWQFLKRKTSPLDPESIDNPFWPHIWNVCTEH